MKDNHTIANIFCILNRGKGSISDTLYFEGKNHDDLVEEFCSYLDKHKLFISTHLEITQSLNDRGTDLILRSNDSKLGFQIKSHYDVTEEDFAANVKRQITESSAHGLDKWYLIICSPLKSKGKDLSKKIQHLQNEISSYQREDIEVYSPRNTIKFFNNAVPLTEAEFAESFQNKENIDVQVSFTAKYVDRCLDGELYELQIAISNSSLSKTINQYKLEFTFPDLSVHSNPYISEAVGNIQDDFRSADNISISKSSGFYQVIYFSKSPIFPNDTIEVGKDIDFRYCSYPNLRGSDKLVVKWKFHTDDGYSIIGDTSIFDLWYSSQ